MNIERLNKALALAEAAPINLSTEMTTLPSGALLDLIYEAKSMREEIIARNTRELFYDGEGRIDEMVAFPNLSEANQQATIEYWTSIND